MAHHELQPALGQWLRRQLEEGVVVGDEVLDYLEATFGTRYLAEVLDAEENSEVDSLMELLFYPDIDLQLKFEGRWGRTTFTETDLKAVTDALCADPPVAQLKLRETGEKIFHPVPAFACSTFVQRLNISSTIPSELVQVLDRRKMDDTALMSRVQLRNARLIWHNGQVELAEQFLAKMPVPSNTFSPDLDFLISILAELASDDDAYDFLVGKKFFYFKSLCSAEDFEHKRASSNMEIMMMGGVRSAHGNIAEWRRLMKRIDRICQAIFGRTEFFQRPESQTVDLIDGRNLKDVIQKLS